MVACSGVVSVKNRGLNSRHSFVHHTDTLLCVSPCRVFRCTLTSIPQTQSLLNKAKLPLGLLLHPFKDLSVGNTTTHTLYFCCTLCAPVAVENTIKTVAEADELMKHLAVDVLCITHVAPPRTTLLEPLLYSPLHASIVDTAIILLHQCFSKFLCSRHTIGPNLKAHLYSYTVHAQFPLTHKCVAACVVIQFD